MSPTAEQKKRLLKAKHWKDSSAKACANIPVNGLLGADRCSRTDYFDFVLS
jgi:hypothetical protein